MVEGISHSSWELQRLLGGTYCSYMVAEKQQAGYMHNLAAEMDNQSCLHTQDQEEELLEHRDEEDVEGEEALT